MVVVAVGGLDAVAALLAATEAPALHETGDAIAAMSTSSGTEFVGDPGRAVGLAARGMNDRDLISIAMELQDDFRKGSDLVEV